MSISEPVVAPSEQESEQEPLDAWGNTILDAPGPMDQYRIKSVRDGRVLHVCGEATSQKHLLFWKYDADERRCVCRLCWGLSMRQKSDEQETSQANGQANGQEDGDAEPDA